MKALAAAAILFGLFASSGRADTNFLTNGDFRNGLANWSGDFRLMTKDDRCFTGSVDLTKGASGIIADLCSKSGASSERNYWFAVYQTFESHGETLNYSITYQLSDDYEPKDKILIPSAIPGIPTAVDITNVQSYFGFAARPSPSSALTIAGPDFAIAVTDKTTGAFAVDSIHPSGGSIVPQTSSGTLVVRNSGQKMVFVIFKEGVGKVALYNVSLTPSDLPASIAPLSDPMSSIPQHL